MAEYVTSKPLQILLVDSDQAFAERLGRLCDDSIQPHLAFTWESDATRAGELLRSQPFDVLLLGTGTTPHPSLTPFTQLKKSAANLPIILLNNADDDDTSLLAVREGAEDYLVKGAFDGHELLRVLRYAIERKRVEARLRQSEEFFRLISENVTDLIAVVDRRGRRLYNNPAYERSLGPITGLAGTNSFSEIHPDDRLRIQSVFQETLQTGQGQRTEYRMLLKDREVRFIESLGSVVRDERGQPDKIVVVSRDITERRRAMDELQQTVAQLRQAHEDLHTAQARLVQTEKIEALSTFAAAIAHEVRNPLQTILLGIGFLRESLREPSDSDVATQQLVLADLENAANKADAVIQGLMEFTAYRQQEIEDHNLSELLEQSVHAVAAEMSQRKINVTLELQSDLPSVRVDARKIRHVLIKLLLGLADQLPPQANLALRTCQVTAQRPSPPGVTSPGRPPMQLVGIELEHAAPINPATPSDSSAPALVRKEDLDLMVVKKVVELYGGLVETHSNTPKLSRIGILFRVDPRPAL